MTPADLPLSEIRELALAAFATAAGLDRALLTRPGTTVAAEPARADTRLASAYLLDQHLVIRCDPAVADRCRGLLAPSTTHTLADFEAATRHWSRLGRARAHVIDPERVAGPGPVDGRRLDADDLDDLALIAALVTDDPEGADWAEIDIENLDAHVFGVVIEGRLAAYASERPWDLDSRFGDIGVLAHPDFRRRGLTMAVTRALCRSLFDQDRLPLYRCDHDNVASNALADRIGFTEVTELSAVRFRG